MTISAAQALRKSFDRVMSWLLPIPWRRLFRPHGRHAEADGVDSGAAAAFVGWRRVVAGVEQAAQCERQRSGLARQRKRLGLARAELERRGLADHHALAVFLFNHL